MQKQYIRFGFLLHLSLAIVCMIALLWTGALLVLLFSPDVEFLRPFFIQDFLSFYFPERGTLWIQLLLAGILWILILGTLLYQRWAIWSLILLVVLGSGYFWWELFSEISLTRIFDIIIGGCVILLPITLIFSLIRLTRMIRLGKNIPPTCLTPHFPGWIPLCLAVVSLIGLLYGIYSIYPTYSEVPDSFFKNVSDFLPPPSARKNCSIPIPETLKRFQNPSNNLVIQKRESKMKFDGKYFSSMSGSTLSSGALQDDSYGMIYFEEFQKQIADLDVEIEVLQKNNPESYETMKREADFSPSDRAEIQKLLTSLEAMTQLPPNGCVPPESDFYSYPHENLSYLRIIDLYREWSIERGDFTEAIRIMKIEKALYTMLYSRSLSSLEATLGIWRESSLLNHIEKLLVRAPQERATLLSLIDSPLLYEEVARNALFADYERVSNFSQSGTLRKLKDISIPWFFDGQKTDNFLRLYYYQTLTHSGNTSQMLKENEELRAYPSYNLHGVSYTNFIMQVDYNISNGKKLDERRRSLIERYK